jgi:hypothetical protein
MHRAIQPEPIIDDCNLQTIFFDSISNVVVIGNIVRAVAFEFRSNPISGAIERIAVCRIARPVSATMAIRAEFTRATTEAQGLHLAE